MQELIGDCQPGTISRVFPGLSWLHMDTNVALRLQTWRLIRLGLNQKVIAQKMGMSASAFNRWLHREKKGPASLGALDGLRHFLSELRAEATRDVTAMTPDEVERLETELGVTETERRIRQKVKKQATIKRVKRGRKLASR